jgi:LEA14-like dessication related protein
MKQFILILFILSTIFTSCTIQEVEIGKVDGINLKDLTKDHISLELMVPIKNNNNFSFTISDVNLDLSLNNIALGKVKKCTRLKIPANSSAIQPFEFDIKFSKLVDNPMSLLASVIKNKVGFKATGYIKVRRFVFSKKFDVNENQAVKIFKKGLL